MSNLKIVVDKEGVNAKNLLSYYVPSYSSNNINDENPPPNESINKNKHKNNKLDNSKNIFKTPPSNKKHLLNNSVYKKIIFSHLI